MFRPEGWKNPYKLEAHSTSYDIREAFEAGADAMLEGLKKMGTHTNVAEDGFDIKGVRVFIPREKE